MKRSPPSASRDTLQTFIDERHSEPIVQPDADTQSASEEVPDVPTSPVEAMKTWRVHSSGMIRPHSGISVRVRRLGSLFCFDFIVLIIHWSQESRSISTGGSPRGPGFPLVEPSEQHPAGDHWTFISGLQDLLSSTMLVLGRRGMLRIARFLRRRALAALESIFCS
ncbi:hypothetical protein NE237_005580 [Protea cynaroides]|uniref:Uncharacterized protein n=1 Tax=Protea cynaroides TaxID=273540 RepID=A0A9Q0GLQ0_9MAGN|nr:hypothetical protein NE237_005580 [Protea cynaroides]